MYKGAKPGQTVYYARNWYEEREAVELIAYTKDRQDLTHPNCAVILDNGLRMRVDIKNIYRLPSEGVK